MAYTPVLFRIDNSSTAHPESNIAYRGLYSVTENSTTYTIIFSIVSNQANNSAKYAPLEKGAMKVIFDGKTVTFPKNTTYKVNGDGWQDVCNDGSNFFYKQVTKTTTTQTFKLIVKYNGKTGTHNFSVPALQSYTISYNANGGSGAPASQTKWYGINLKLSSTIPTFGNNVFKEWRSQYSYNNKDTYKPGEEYKENASNVMYATYWPPYEVNYFSNANSGDTVTDVPEKQYKKYNINLTLSNKVPKYSNNKFKFLHWNTSTYNTGTTYSSNGVTYTSNAALNLYAIWQRTISYNLNGGTYNGKADSFSETSFKHDQTKITEKVPIKTGYKFKNWQTAASTPTYYSTSQTIAANSPSLDLKANWTPNIDSFTIVDKDAKTIRVNNVNSTEEDDEGTCAYIKIPFALTGMAQTVVSYSINDQNIRNKVNTEKSSPTSVTINPSSGTSNGYFVIYLQNLDLQEQYKVPITLTASNQSTTQVITRTKTTTISAAFFTIDVKVGGKGIAFGAPATEDLFNMAMKQFKITANENNEGIMSFASKGGRSGNFIKLIGGNDNLGDAMLIGDGGLTVIGSGESAINYYNIIKPQSWTTNTEEMIVASDSAIQFYTHCNDVDKSPMSYSLMHFDTSGSLSLKSPKQIINNDNGTTTTSYPNPRFMTKHFNYNSYLSNNNVSSTIWPMGLSITDENETTTSNFCAAIYPDGLISTGIFAYNRANAEQVDPYSNYFYVGVNKAGAKSYSWGDTTAARNSLGASSGIWPISLGGSGQNGTLSYPNKITASTNITIASGQNQIWKWGKVVTLRVQYRHSTGNSATNTPIGTISDASLRPCTTVTGQVYGASSPTYFYIGTNGIIYQREAIAANTDYLCTITYLTA